jgi:hypothetical protein
MAVGAGQASRPPVDAGHGVDHDEGVIALINRRMALPERAATVTLLTMAGFIMLSGPDRARTVVSVALAIALITLELRGLVARRRRDLHTTRSDGASVLVLMVILAWLLGPLAWRVALPIAGLATAAASAANRHRVIRQHARGE